MEKEVRGNVVDMKKRKGFSGKSTKKGRQQIDWKKKEKD